MFPSAAFKNTITLYSYHKMEDGLETYKRAVLTGVFWKGDSIALFKKTGQQIKNNITILVPHSEHYKPFTQWRGADGYTIHNGKNPTYLYKGVCDFEFEYSDGKGLSRQLEQFCMMYTSARQCLDINENFFGNRHMWHIAVRC